MDLVRKGLLLFLIFFFSLQMSAHAICMDEELERTHRQRVRSDTEKEARVLPNSANLKPLQPSKSEKHLAKKHS